MATGLDKVKELFADGELLTFSGDADKMPTELSDGDILLDCGSALDCLLYPRPSYATGNIVEKTLLDAWLYLGNCGLESWWDNAPEADKEVIKAACPNFYNAAKNVFTLENGPFCPCAIIGKVNNGNKDFILTPDDLNRAINAMDAAWTENADAENGEKGEDAMIAMGCAYDMLLNEAGDAQFSCQLRLQVIENTPEGIKVNFDAGLPLNDVFTPLFSVIIPDAASEPEIKEIIRNAAFTAGFSELLAY